jgi:hypothetical protein
MSFTLDGNKNVVAWSKTLDGDEAPDVSESTDNKVTKN